jgi:hypothetical protein
LLCTKEKYYLTDRQSQLGNEAMDHIDRYAVSHILGAIGSWRVRPAQPDHVLFFIFYFYLPFFLVVCLDGL